MPGRPTDLLSQALAALERAEAPAQAGAWITLATPDQLRARVAELTAAAARGSVAPAGSAALAGSVAPATPADLPLLGVTFGVKDNIDVAGWTTTAACPDYAYLAARTAPAVQRMLDAGAILIGKTNLDQFATGLVGTRSPYGTPRNVIDPRLVPGGSSSGSGIAVAGGAVDVALGTDTAGSGRVPAALNGIVGLKPTAGLVSTSGVVPACRSLDCVSVFARDVRDAARVLAVIEGFDAEDPFSREGPVEAFGSVDHPRVGVPGLTPDAFAGDREAQAAFDAACDLLAARGAILVPVDAAPFLRAGELLYDGPWVAERAAGVGAFVREQSDAVLPVTRELILRGFGPSAVAAFEGRYELERLRARTRATFAANWLDAIALPTIPTLVTLEQDAADPIGRNALLGRFTHCGNLLDLSALALPAPARADGGPSSLMLLGEAFSDRVLLGIGSRFAGEQPRPADMSAAPTAAISDTAAQAAAETASAPSAAASHTATTIELLVVGAHMSGMPLEPQLRDLGGRPLGAARTAAGYRMLALAHLTPPRPGLVADPSGAGGLAGELWALPPAGLGRLLTLLAFPLSLGPVELDDGRLVTGFLCSPHALPDAPDITAHGGWRAYLPNAVGLDRHASSLDSTS
ncbi:allophanate hydrolase [Conexibacter sp. CPCC 206217]|uniref:allophanate hydrolase n=1 Tax=Conexibacter sp. CPCC 206217 TaxID=3064574 RepID=UPI002726A259|nr:allophanate hydrolase [Conexibacter sp. CPCC 206217]MDO8209867.1 allophanate hydrolase [Conexibacter sp. CPCC 206217]